MASAYSRVFLSIASTYVKKYPEHSFQFYFDEDEPIMIGESERVVKVYFKNTKSVLERMFLYGSLGLGECYCEGLIKVADAEYKYFLFIFVRAGADKNFWKELSIADLITIFRARLSATFFSRKNQAENINAHYSLHDWFTDEDSNKFYMYWLGSSYVQYSCGRWLSDTKTLEEAQVNKFEHYRKRMGIDENSRGKTLLDLGCGWGGFMFYLTEKYALQCTGMTLSTAQAKYIEEEIDRRKFNNRVRVIVDNVYNMSGQYDHIISLGMLEHITDYDDLIKKSARVLKKDGTAVFHSIFHTSFFYRPDPFLTKYIFPGGGTPRKNRLVRIYKKYFTYVDCEDMPELSYPKTLAAWRENFCRNEKEIRTLLQKNKNIDVDHSVRIFKHYLTLAEVGLTVSGGVFHAILKQPKLF